MGIFDRGATLSAGMQRRSNAAELLLRAARRRYLRRRQLAPIGDHALHRAFDPETTLLSRFLPVMRLGPFDPVVTMPSLTC